MSLGNGAGGQRQMLPEAADVQVRATEVMPLTEADRRAEQCGKVEQNAEVVCRGSEQDSDVQHCQQKFKLKEEDKLTAQGQQATTEQHHQQPDTYEDAQGIDQEQQVSTGQRHKQPEASEVVQPTEQEYQADTDQHHEQPEVSKGVPPTEQEHQNDTKQQRDESEISGEAQRTAKEQYISTAQHHDRPELCGDVHERHEPCGGVQHTELGGYTGSEEHNQQSAASKEGRPSKREHPTGPGRHCQQLEVTEEVQPTEPEREAEPHQQHSGNVEVHLTDQDQRASTEQSQELCTATDGVSASPQQPLETAELLVGSDDSQAVMAKLGSASLVGSQATNSEIIQAPARVGDKHTMASSAEEDGGDRSIVGAGNQQKADCEEAAGGGTPSDGGDTVNELQSEGCVTDVAVLNLADATNSEQRKAVFIAGNGVTSAPVAGGGAAVDESSVPENDVTSAPVAESGAAVDESSVPGNDVTSAPVAESGAAVDESSVPGNGVTSAPAAGGGAAVDEGSAAGNDVISAPVAGSGAAVDEGSAAGNDVTSTPVAGSDAAVNEGNIAGNDVTSALVAGSGAAIDEDSAAGNGVVSSPVAGSGAAVDEGSTVQLVNASEISVTLQKSATVDASKTVPDVSGAKELDQSISKGTVACAGAGSIGPPTNVKDNVQGIYAGCRPKQRNQSVAAQITAPGPAVGTAPGPAVGKTDAGRKQEQKTKDDSTEEETGHKKQQSASETKPSKVATAGKKKALSSEDKASKEAAKSTKGNKKTQDKTAVGDDEELVWKMFGKYQCTYCMHRWTSANSWGGMSQLCGECFALGWEQYIFPYSRVYRQQKPTAGKGKPHLRDLCEMCWSLGRSCIPLTIVKLKKSRPRRGGTRK